MVFNAKKNDAKQGLMAWFFASTRRWFFVFLFAAVAILVLVAEQCKWVKGWPFDLACECAVVAVGICCGWCWVKYDRAKMTRSIYPDSDLDRLGFFNSRIAMRSLALFKITIADFPMEAQQKKDVLALVEAYWRDVEGADEPLPPVPPAGGQKVGGDTSKQGGPAGTAPPPATPASTAKPDEPEEPSRQGQAGSDPPDPGSQDRSRFKPDSGTSGGSGAAEKDVEQDQEVLEPVNVQRTGWEKTRV